MDTFLAKFLGRNYHLAMLICVCAFFLCLYNHMTGGEYSMLCGGVFSSFRAGDAIVNWIHSRNPDKAPDPADDTSHNDHCPPR